MTKSRSRHRIWWPWGVAAVLGGMMGARVLVRRGMRWGSTAWEQVVRLPGDSCLEGGPATRLRMTRAVSIDAPPETVWPWLAQLGRGAGWYSIDRFDNGGRPSADHIVSWIPPPRVGDASAIGYLRHVEPGRALTWWVPGERVAGATTRMAFDIHLSPDNGGSRLVTRVSADATGWSARPLVGVFAVIDSVMVRRQLMGIKHRAETHGARPVDPDRPETGDRDQYQLYEVVYAGGERAGVPGREKAAVWRDAMALPTKEVR